MKPWLNIIVLITPAGGLWQTKHLPDGTAVSMTTLCRATDKQKGIRVDFVEALELWARMLEAMAFGEMPSDRAEISPRPKRAVQIDQDAGSGLWRINATRKATAISCRMSCCFHLLKNTARRMSPRGFGASRPRHGESVARRANGLQPVRL